MSLKNIQTSYDEVAHRYDANYAGLKYRARAYCVEKTLRKMCKSKRVLELGCGTGRLADSLTSKHGCSYIGVDVSEKMLEAARNKGHEVVLGNAEELPFASEEFDVVAAAKGVFRYLNVDLAFKEAHRVLKSKGVVVVHQYAQKTKSIRGNQSQVNASHLISENDYDALALKNGFSKIGIEKWRSISFPPYIVPIPLRIKGEWWSQINLFFQKT